MKLAAGCILIAVGMLLIVFCVVIRSQFKTAVAQANPNFDAYPLVKPFIPINSNDNGVAAAERIAEMTLFRIYAVGAVGFFLSPWDRSF